MKYAEGDGKHLEGKNAVRAGFVEKKGTFDLNLRK
jgi:hypothetical protein